MLCICTCALRYCTANMPVDQPNFVIERAAADGTADGDMDVWMRKYQNLKKKCSEYQRMNDMLFLRAKEIHKVIEKAEAETRYLVKKLEQYEEVDYPKCLPSARAEANGLKIDSSYLPYTPTPNHVLMTAAATRVRAELELALSQNGDLEAESPRSQSQTAERSSAHSSAPPVPGTQSTVTQGPPHLIPIPSPSPVLVPDKSPLGPPKTKKLKKTFKGLPEKLVKSSLKGAAAAKRRRGDIDPNAPKKPSNAFFWFCQARRAELQEQFKGEGTTGQHDLTKALAKLWGETNAEDKKPYYEQYALDKARYDHEMEEYIKLKQASSVPPSPSIPPLTNQIAEEGSVYSMTIATPEL